MTRTEKHKEYMRKYYYEHKEEIREYKRKWRAEHRDKINARHRKYRADHIEEYNDMKRKYRAEDLNKYGVTKSSIRVTSGRILDKCHAKLPNYEIHHCFGYDDAEKFIYIPKSLHLQIHQLLRDKNIPSDSDHWNYIRELVNSCEEYTYIRI